VRERTRTVAGEIREEFLVVSVVVTTKAVEGAGAQESAAGWVLCAVVETRRRRGPVGLEAATEEAEVGDAPVVGVGAAGPRTRDCISLTGGGGVIVVV
jgi:hypothetical protein